MRGNIFNFCAENSQADRCRRFNKVWPLGLKHSVVWKILPLFCVFFGHKTFPREYFKLMADHYLVCRVPRRFLKLLKHLKILVPILIAIICWLWWVNGNGKLCRPWLKWCHQLKIKWWVMAPLVQVAPQSPYQPTFRQLNQQLFGLNLILAPS